MKEAIDSQTVNAFWMLDSKRQVLVSNVREYAEALIETDFVAPLIGGSSI